MFCLDRWPKHLPEYDRSKFTKLAFCDGRPCRKKALFSELELIMLRKEIFEPPACIKDWPALRRSRHHLLEFAFHQFVWLKLEWSQVQLVSIGCHSALDEWAFTLFHWKNWRSIAAKPTCSKQNAKGITAFNTVNLNIVLARLPVGEDKSAKNTFELVATNLKETWWERHDHGKRKLVLHFLEPPDGAWNKNNTWYHRNEKSVPPVPYIEGKTGSFWETAQRGRVTPHCTMDLLVRLDELAPLSSWQLMLRILTPAKPQYARFKPHTPTVTFTFTQVLTFYQG